MEYGQLLARHFKINQSVASTDSSYVDKSPLMFLWPVTGLKAFDMKISPWHGTTCDMTRHRHLVNISTDYIPSVSTGYFTYRPVAQLGPDCASMARSGGQ